MPGPLARDAAQVQSAPGSREYSNVFVGSGRRTGAIGLPHEIMHDEGGDPDRGLPAQPQLSPILDMPQFVFAHAEGNPGEYVPRVTHRPVATWNRSLLEYMGAERLGGVGADAGQLLFI